MAKIDSDFSVNHAATATFEADGPAPYFEYRDLGVKDATKGAIAHVIRAAEAFDGRGTDPRRHERDFQLVNVPDGVASTGMKPSFLIRKQSARRLAIESSATRTLLDSITTGAACSTSELPQLAQNLLFGGLLVPHFGHSTGSWGSAFALPAATIISPSSGRNASTSGSRVQW